ncbi:MAG: protein translocase subunit SecD [Patescibacteria group bacterium]
MQQRYSGPASRRSVASGRTASPSSARMLAVIFLCAGILLGAFALPGVFRRAPRLIGLPYILPLPDVPFRFGLDIKGGAHLVYRADVSDVEVSSHGAAMEALRDVIERRVNIFGVAEPVVQVERSGGEWRLIVELAGVYDTNEAIKMIGLTPYLEFRTPRPEAERDAILKDIETKGPRAGEDPYFAPSPLTGRFIRRADVVQDQTTFRPQISLELTDEGAEIFRRMTRENIGKQIAIYLDGSAISAPVVQEEISGGKAQITGQFTDTEARILVGRLNAGALPVPMTLIGQQSIGASLGQESLDRSLSAGIIGFAAVAVFMILWYRLPGLLAVLALCFYVMLALAVFKAAVVTLTAAGIAGFILSVGMAVDANVLIFERMKEELIVRGSGLREAAEKGFSRAWPSIRDSNVSSLITAGVLYWFGTSVVKGFAVAFSIGVLVSMFTAITVTRAYLRAILIPQVMRHKFLFLSGIARDSIRE